MTSPNLYAEAVVESFRFGEYLIAAFERGRDIDLQCCKQTNKMKFQPCWHKCITYSAEVSKVMWVWPSRDNHLLWHLGEVL